jgi:N-carbamoyl-L-amino-acid hydrolase
MLNPKRTVAELKELRQLTENERGAQRIAWTETWQKARDWFQEKLKPLPVEVYQDAAGNLWATLKGESEKALIIGSHLDCVPSGGWLDGCMGVVAGLEVMRRIHEQYNGKPPVTIRIVDWADEEGARFGRSLMGSAAFAGNHTIEADRNRLDRDGIRLEDVLKKYGVDINKFADAEKERKNAAAYLELHIEQGPVLEKLGLPLGVVTGTKGVERHAITFHGLAVHSGATPMNLRQDALAAAAKLALEIRPIATKHPDAVCTMGSVKTIPGIVTAVVGKCETTLDQRDLDTNVLKIMVDEAIAKSKQFAEEEGCTVEWSPILKIEPVPFHADLIRFGDEAVLKASGKTIRLPSGPLHDAAEVARAGIPTAMIFTQSLKGISHNKIEDTEEAHIEMGVTALDDLTDQTIAWILKQ